MDKCDTCKNKGAAWCRGCEYRQPGLEQFDFYQSVKKEDTADNNEEAI